MSNNVIKLEKLKSLLYNNNPDAVTVIDKIGAVKQIGVEIQKGNLDPQNIDEKLFASYLQTSEIGDPDLLIRTSGELRISNFLLWQIAYSEIYITPTLWPDFDKAEFYKAIENYQHRERRFGKVSDQL